MLDLENTAVPVLLYDGDEEVGRASIRLELDAEAPNGVTAVFVETEWYEEEPEIASVEAHFTSVRLGVAFLAALDPTMIGKDC